MITRQLKQKFWNKRVNAAKEGIEFNLTLDQFIGLMDDKNLAVEDLHIMGYHLSRHNDSGAYEIGNCEFKFYLDNYAEKKISEKARKASRKNLQDYNRKLA